MEGKAFPRGGATDEDRAEGRNHTKFHWLPAEKKKRPLKKSRNDSESDPDVDYELEERLQAETETKVTIHDLAYTNIQPKMKLLGRVAEIHNDFVKVYIPGGLIGTIPICNIIAMLGSGDHGTDKYVNAPALSDILKEDQLVITEVTNVVKEAKSKQKIGTAVYLTVNPANIYQGWSHTNVAQIGLILQAYVRSVEDHGYILDCGIKDLHAFLSQKECEKYCKRWNNGNPLAKGQIVCGVVIKAKPANVRSQIELSIEPGKISRAQKKTLDYVEDASQLLPGMRYILEVTKKLNNGLSVIFDEYEGFIIDRNIPHNLKNSDVGDSFLGCLLYISKPLNVAMFSIIPSVVDPIAAPVREFKFGDIVKSAVVISESFNGVGLLLNKKTGTRGRIPSSYMKNAEKESNSRGFHRVGSTVSCRILNFDSLSETFLCTTLESALKERFFSTSDVPVGSIVTATVTGVTDKYLIVLVGAVPGYIQWYHTADTPQRKFAEKFAVGRKIKGRVLRHIGEKLDITAKEFLVKKGCAVLKSYDQVIPGMCYPGTIVAFKEDGLIVAFFGGVRGFLPYSNTDESFKMGFSNKGRLIKCSVVSCSGEKLVLSVNDSIQNLAPGFKCSPIVSGIDTKNRILQVMSGCDVRGAIPVYHVHDSQTLADKIFRTYSIGDVIEDARCFVSAPVVVFSTRGSVRRFFDSDVGKAVMNGSVSALQPGNVIPCFVKNVDSNVTLSTPLIDSGFVHRIRREDIVNQDPQIGDYLPLVVKDAVKSTYDKLVLDVFEDKAQTSVDFMADILHGNKMLEEHAIKSSLPLSTFNFGDDVRGAVESSDFGYKVCMPNGVRGHVNTFCSDGNPVVGEIVDGKVIYVDYERLELILSLQESVRSNLLVKKKKNFSDVEDGSVVSGRIVRGFTEFYLALIKVGDSLRRAFIPKQFYPIRGAPLAVDKRMVGKELKFRVVQKCDADFLCVPKKMLKRKANITEETTADSGAVEGQDKKKRKKRKRRNSSSSVEAIQEKVTKKDRVKIVSVKNRKNKNRSVETVNGQGAQNGGMDASATDDVKISPKKLTVVELPAPVASDNVQPDKKLAKSKNVQKQGFIQKLCVVEQLKKKVVTANVDLPKKLKNKNVVSAVIDSVTEKEPRTPFVVSSSSTKKTLNRAKLAKYRNIFKSARKPVKRLRK